MRLGIAGAGMIVRGLFSFIHEIEGIELEAIASTEKSIEKVKQMAKENHVKKAYLNYDELLNDEDIEVMYIATPNHLHYQLAKEKHLFLFEAISTQYLPNVLKIKEKLNELGNIKIVTANYSQYSSRYNAFKEGIIQPAFDYTKSGGALMDLNIYNIHLMVALFGKPLKVNYMANIEKNIDTSGIITLDYGNFKAVLIGAKDCKAPIATSIQGDQGCISIQTPANVLRSFKILHNDQREETFDLQGDTHRMVYEFNEFVKMIENKDFDRANEMMEKSLIAMDIATKARIDAGVHFKADESYE